MIVLTESNLEGLAARILREHKLCDACLARQVEYFRQGSLIPSSIKSVRTDSTREECFLCNGLMSETEHFSDKIFKALQGYEFKTIQVGASLPASLAEKEDSLRAKYKLRGGEPLKTAFTRTVGNRLVSKLRKKYSFNRPDLLVLVQPKEDTFKILPSPLFLFGRYIKTNRGLPQRRTVCRDCRGKGCEKCEMTGFYPDVSVESVLAKAITEHLGASKVKFTWIGSEDKQSLVLGSGRPFYAEVYEPRIRRVPKALKRSQSEEGLIVRSVREVPQIPKTSPSFRVKVTSNLALDRDFSKEDAMLLRKALRRCDVEMYSTSKNKVLIKKVYSFSAKPINSKKVAMTFTCDGGLHIRRFLTGEDGTVRPNVAGLLGRKVSLDEVAPFDFQVILEGVHRKS